MTHLFKICIGNLVNVFFLTSAAGGAALCVSTIEPHVGRLRLWRRAGRRSDLVGLRFLLGDAAMDLVSPERRGDSGNWSRIVKSNSRLKSDRQVKVTQSDSSCCKLDKLGIIM